MQFITKKDIMNWNNFKLVCFNEGIDLEVIEACRDFVEQHDVLFRRSKTNPKWAQSDLGYSELADITTVMQGLKDIKEHITGATCDYDALGRSKERILLKKLRKDPGKGIKRSVLKTVWLIS